jgi:hypothetical protein
MKTLPFTLVLGLLISINGFSQNRIYSWNTEKISSILIETKITDDKIEVRKIDKKEAMDTLFLFLKQIDFRQIDNFDFDKTQVLSQWIFRMTFQGQPDQIIFCQDYATIGKTIYRIDNKVIDDLKEVY